MHSNARWTRPPMGNRPREAVCYTNLTVEPNKIHASRANWPAAKTKKSPKVNKRASHAALPAFILNAATRRVGGRAPVWARNSDCPVTRTLGSPAPKSARTKVRSKPEKTGKTPSRPERGAENTYRAPQGQGGFPPLLNLVSAHSAAAPQTKAPNRARRFVSRPNLTRNPVELRHNQAFCRCHKTNKIRS